HPPGSSSASPALSRTRAHGSRQRKSAWGPTHVHRVPDRLDTPRAPTTGIASCHHRSELHRTGRPARDRSLRGRSCRPPYQCPSSSASLLTKALKSITPCAATFTDPATTCPPAHSGRVVSSAPVQCPVGECSWHARWAL